MRKMVLFGGMTAVIAAAGLGFASTLSLSAESAGKEITVVEAAASSQSELKSKKITDPEIVLVDSRNGKEIETIKASDMRTEEQAIQKAAVLEAAYDQPMQPARLNSKGGLQKGTSRIVLDKEALLKKLENVSVYDREIEVPITETAPNVTKKTAAGAGDKLLASYVTKFDSSVTGRTRNIELSAQAINQIILGPGDRFYYNLIVGERTEARGYQKAMEIVNKELVEGIGGGICQTSSTLYNAVYQAGLKIIELHHHSKQVGYVPKDMDATVSYGGKDFKFENNKPYPVVIQTIVNKKAGTLEVQVRAPQKG